MNEWKAIMMRSTWGWLPILSAVLLLCFWALFALLLPMQEPYLYWVLDDDWHWINLIGFSGSLLGVLATVVIFAGKQQRSLSDQLFFAAAIMGAVLLTSILFFEAFILKGLTTLQPSLVDPTGPLYQQATFTSANLAAGLFYSVGWIGLAISMMRESLFKRWKLIMIMVGTPLFSIMLMPGNLRLVGVLLYCIALMAMGAEMLAKQKKG